jgi:RNA polymerase sigma factor (sigma-70 family)
LSEDHRAVLELACFEGLSLTEIGERLSIAVGTAKSRLSRALERLRSNLLAAQAEQRIAAA